ncbi:dachshund b isoform X1 [Esox lucius]|uniref:dachshund b isoform X1 n=1 Tax=Esox lucius TaxID=8010 RepID=UPI001476DC57|nr:dachshund b isoform X1 [Esox lucius]
MSTTISANPVVPKPCSGAPSSGGVFRSETLYIPTSTSPHSDSLSPSPRLSTTGLHSPFQPSPGVPLGGLGLTNTPVSGDRVISTTTTTPSDCRMVDVHGVKVASFNVAGQEELICLPQVYELFLKHLVGGLHTVYTKLKRLDIYPVVCTVEQVRVLRGLGAIQPGVNRCKLISRRDFEALYNDCTNASSRPGRPPKRSAGGGIQESPRPLLPAAHGLLSPGMLSHTAAAMAGLQKLQKMKVMMMQGGGANGQRNRNKSDDDDDDRYSTTGGIECSWGKERLESPPSGGGELRTGMGGQQGLNQVNSLQQHHLLASRLQELPFMMMPHHLLPVGLPPVSVAMAMSQMNHLNTIANMAAAAQIPTNSDTHQAPLIKERVCESVSPSPSVAGTHTPPRSRHSSQASSSASSSPDRLHGDLTHRDTLIHMKNIAREKDDSSLAHPMMKPSDRLSLGQALPPGFPAPFLFADGISSVETLLTNIQGLLKVAVENARVQDKQIQTEKRELKMELYREREMRESLERRLTNELQSRASIQKRLKKEKKLKRKLQEALEFESKRRERVEDVLKLSSSPLTPHKSVHTSSQDTVLQQEEPEFNGTLKASPSVQEPCPFLKADLLF